jgi:aspartate carbamoyltransferase catalytic subunit
MTQQEFSQAAMTTPGMTRDEFAMRLGCAKRTLDKWLQPDTSNDYRAMNETIWGFIREILEHEKLKIKYAQLQQHLAKKFAYPQWGHIMPPIKKINTHWRHMPAINDPT